MPCAKEHAACALSGTVTFKWHCTWHDALASIQSCLTRLEGGRVFNAAVA